MAAGGVFNLIALDGKQDRMVSLIEVLYKWPWEQFITSGRCTIFVETPDSPIFVCYRIKYLELYGEGAEMRTGTYLDLLPRDIRKYIIAPMCNFITRWRLTGDGVGATIASAEAAGRCSELIRESGLAYPCSVWQAIGAIASR